MKDSILIEANVPAGAIIGDGYQYRKAPKEGVAWDLYEVYETESNTHLAFRWVKAGTELDL